MSEVGLENAHDGGCACGAVRYRVAGEPRYDARMPLPLERLERPVTVAGEAKAARQAMAGAVSA